MIKTLGFQCSWGLGWYYRCPLFRCSIPTVSRSRGPVVNITIFGRLQRITRRKLQHCYSCDTALWTVIPTWILGAFLPIGTPLQWRHMNATCSVKYQGFFKRFRQQQKKYQSSHYWPFVSDPPVIGEFPPQRTSNAKKFSCHDAIAHSTPHYALEQHMMTSSNGNIFRVTGHLCGEFTSPRWIPHTKASDAELWCFLWSASE